MTVKEAMRKQEKEILVSHSKGTHRFYVGKMKTIIDYLWDYECNKIDRDTTLDFIMKLKERNSNISNSTINKYVGTLRRAVRDQCSIEIPFKKFREERKVIEAVPKEYIELFLSHFKKKMSNRHSFRNYLYFRTLLETGMRFGEIITLEVNHIDFNTNTIVVKKTKGKRERYVFISPELSKLITLYVGRYSILGLLFASASGKPLQHEAINAIIMRARKSLEIPRHVPLNNHAWRHTFATNYCKRGGNLETLRLIMGHSDIKITQKYIHLSSEYLRDDYIKTMSTY